MTPMVLKRLESRIDAIAEALNASVRPRPEIIYCRADLGETREEALAKAGFAANVPLVIVTVVPWPRHAEMGTC